MRLTIRPGGFDDSSQGWTGGYATRGSTGAVWRWFTEAAWAAGQIPTPDVPVEWSPPKFEAVDPQKDAMANLLSIRSGTMTLAEVIARQGRNPDAVLAEIAATNAKLDALRIVARRADARAVSLGRRGM